MKKVLKKAQANVVEFILLMSISLLVVYEIYTIISNWKFFFLNEIYSKADYIIANYVINDYFDKKLLKESIKATNLSYYIYLPEKIFPGGYFITTKTINVNGENKKFLMIYSTGGISNVFAMSYRLNKNFSYVPGTNLEIIK